MNVEENTDNSFTARASSLDKSVALNQAIDLAEKYCDKSRTLYISKDVIYEGSLNENDNQKIKDISNATMILGQGGLGQSDYAVKGNNLYHAKVIFNCK